MIKISPDRLLTKAWRKMKKIYFKKKKKKRWSRRRQHWNLISFPHVLTHLLVVGFALWRSCFDHHTDRTGENCWITEPVDGDIFLRVQASKRVSSKSPSEKYLQNHQAYIPPLPKESVINRGEEWRKTKMLQQSLQKANTAKIYIYGSCATCIFPSASCFNFNSPSIFLSLSFVHALTLSPSLPLCWNLLFSSYCVFQPHSLAASHTILFFIFFNVLFFKPFDIGESSSIIWLGVREEERQASSWDDLNRNCNTIIFLATVYIFFIASVPLRNYLGDCVLHFLMRNFHTKQKFINWTTVFSSQILHQHLRAMIFAIGKDAGQANWLWRLSRKSYFRLGEK